MGVFYAKEILHAAIQIEHNISDFYGHLAQQERRSAIRDVFNYLADEEKDHLNKLELAERQLEEPPETWEREDFDLYLDALVSEHMFKEEGSGEKRAKEVQSDPEALGLAIQLEKDVILFFHELRALARSEDRELMTQLIEWERDHLIRLLRLKREVEDAKRR